MADERQFLVSTETADSVIKLVSTLRGKDGFGNAREIRNLLEGAIRKQASRLSVEASKRQLGKEDLVALNSDDFSSAFGTLHADTAKSGVTAA
jgi:stage V sporulation protein K